MSEFSIAIAGSTTHTVQIADRLFADDRFSIPWILTPSPKLIGRKQVLTKNPLHLWAEEHQLPVILVDQKIDAALRETLTAQPSGKPDFLLVVDFGYLVPNWLLEWPKIAPLNIHPSNLPRWRGSSPGQFVLLYGEKDSAVTLMKMGAGLDTGPIIYQFELQDLPAWTQTEYYFESFERMGEVIAEKIVAFAQEALPAQEQPASSPTPIARRLDRQDGFVNWFDLQAATQGATPPFSSSEPTSALLQEVAHHTQSWPQTLEQAHRAFFGWPGLWSISPADQGQKRLKILDLRLTDNRIQLDKVQWEGQQPTDGKNLKF